MILIRFCYLVSKFWLLFIINLKISGTCFSTRGAPLRPEIKVAGDASSLTITTMHDIGNTFDPLFVSSDLYGVSGLNFAIVDDQVTPQAAMASRAMSVLPGKFYSIEL